MRSKSGVAQVTCLACGQQTRSANIACSKTFYLRKWRPDASVTNVPAYLNVRQAGIDNEEIMVEVSICKPCALRYAHQVAPGQFLAQLSDNLKLWLNLALGVLIFIVLAVIFGDVPHWMIYVRAALQHNLWYLEPSVQPLCCLIPILMILIMYARSWNQSFRMYSVPGKEEKYGLALAWLLTQRLFEPQGYGIWKK